MSGTVVFGLAIALAAGFAAVVLGRNLTRAIAAGATSVAGLAIALSSVHAGFAGGVVATLAILTLAVIQLFGWMLVDVDRDHLPPTDRLTWVARGIAFLLLGGGLALGVKGVLDRGLWVAAPTFVDRASPRAIGELFFGRWSDLATLCGVMLAAALLASLMLLRDDEESR